MRKKKELIVFIIIMIAFFIPLTISQGMKQRFYNSDLNEVVYAILSNSYRAFSVVSYFVVKVILLVWGVCIVRKSYKIRYSLHKIVICLLGIELIMCILSIWNEIITSLIYDLCNIYIYLIVFSVIQCAVSIIWVIYLISIIFDDPYLVIYDMKLHLKSYLIILFILISIRSGFYLFEHYSLHDINIFNGINRRIFSLFKLSSICIEQLTLIIIFIIMFLHIKNILKNDCYESPQLKSIRNYVKGVFYKLGDGDDVIFNDLAISIEGNIIKKVFRRKKFVGNIIIEDINRLNFGKYIEDFKVDLKLDRYRSAELEFPSNDAKRNFLGRIFFHEDFNLFTIMINEETEDNTYGWRPVKGFMLTSTTTREEALVISNQLMQDYLEDRWGHTQALV